ncbi:hypothetical protein E4U21_000162 [Claviceps maximensis]|nr:hypothetical protein E4U21_000162 [Claviceps maximensis]
MEICEKQLQRHVDELGDGVYGIRFTEPDGPITLLTDPEEDVTMYPTNFPLATLKVPFPVKTIYLTSLTELDRLEWQVDKVSYPESPCLGNSMSKKIVVFKYWFMVNGMFRYWSELNCCCRLPRDHPHIVPFDSVVLDDTTHRIVGFTSLYISGGTLSRNNATTRPFRLRWLHQLLSVVDDLNYRYGVMHQDVAPRNLLIDEEDNLRLFDFNYSIMIDKSYMAEWDDWKGVAYTLYEIITLDGHLRDVRPEEQDAEALLQMEWVKHPDVKLDTDIKTFRDVLDVWLTERKSKKFEPADTWVRWEDMPKPLLTAEQFHSPEGKTAEMRMLPGGVNMRRDLIKMGVPFWNWERPASYSLAKALKEDVDEDSMSVKNLDEEATHEKAVDNKVLAYREKKSQ